MKKQLTRLASQCLFLFFAATVLPQSTSWVDPMMPLFPNEADCDQLAKAWSARIAELNKVPGYCDNNRDVGDFSACVNKNACTRCWPEETECGKIFYQTNQDRQKAYNFQCALTRSHQANMSCRATARDAAEKARKEKEEKDKKAEEARLAKEKADRERKDRMIADQTKRDTDKKDTPSPKDSDVDRSPSPSTRTDSSREAERRKAFDIAQDLSVLRQVGFDQRTAERQQRTTILRDNIDQGRDKVNGTANALESRATEVLQALNRISNPLAGPSNAAARTNSVSDEFNFPSPSSGSLVRSFVMDHLVGYVPFAAIPFKIVDHVFGVVEDTSNRLNYAIANFDRLPSNYLDGTVENFGKRAFPPSVLLSATFDPMIDHVKETVSNVVQQEMQGAVQDSLEKYSRTVFGSPSTPEFQAGRQWISDTGGTGTSTNSTKVYSGWEGASYEVRKSVSLDVQRDSTGVPLLFDRNGQVYGWNSQTNRVSYTQSDLATLADQQILAPKLVWQRPTVNSDTAGFLPMDTAAEKISGKMSDWFVTPVFDETKKLYNSSLEQLNGTAPGN